MTACCQASRLFVSVCSRPPNRSSVPGFLLNTFLMIVMSSTRLSRVSRSSGSYPVSRCRQYPVEPTSALVDCPKDSASPLGYQDALPLVRPHPHRRPVGSLLASHSAFPAPAQPVNHHHLLHPASPSPNRLPQFSPSSAYANSLASQTRKRTRRSYMAMRIARRTGSIRGKRSEDAYRTRTGEYCVRVGFERELERGQVNARHEAVWPSRAWDGICRWER